MDDSLQSVNLMKDDWATATMSPPISAKLFQQLQVIEPSSDVDKILPVSGNS
jgi:hypothetical protein